MAPLLDVDNIHKSFGGVKTLTAVTFSLSRGQVLGLIGPNGAGKTTVFNIISGIYRADQGTVLLDGKAITNRAPVAIAKAGVARTFQVARTFNDMTVEENLRVPLVRSSLSRAESDARVVEMLGLTGLSKLRAAMVASLPDGQKKLLEVARAIMIPPKLFILDEPFAGVSADVVNLVIGLIRKLTAAGVGCLAISHDIASMPRLCEEVLVLVEGKVLTRGPLATVRKDRRVVEAYLGA
jgi:ABC-type branched-subunit amino acid transport system ATPase component